MDRINVTMIGLMLVSLGAFRSAHAEPEPWQTVRLFEPTRAQLEAKSADKTIIPQAPEQSVIAASKPVAVDRGVPETKPTMVTRALEVLETAVSVSEPRLELDKSTNSSESNAITDVKRVVNQQREDKEGELTFGVGRVAGLQHPSESASELKSADAVDLRLASAESPGGGPVGDVGMFPIRQMGQDTELHAAVVSEAGEGAEREDFPLAVILALVALVGLVPVARRGVTHT